MSGISPVGVAPGAITTSSLTMATSKLLGRATASTGAIEEIVIGTGLSLSGGGTLSSTATGGTVVNTIKIDQTPAGDTYGLLGGTVNGSNAVFTVSYGSYAAGTLTVFLNGQQQTQGSGKDWTETTPGSGTFTFATAPPTSSIIQAIYSVVATSSGFVTPSAINGRMTTETTVAFSTSDRTSQGTLYWTSENKGNQISLYDGSSWVSVTFPSDFAWPIAATSGKNYDMFVFTTTATPSSTNTSTEIITFGSAQGWTTGALVSVATTGGGLTAGTTYWWNAASSTTGSFHTTLADALAGTNKVDLTASITSSLTGLSFEPSAEWTNDTTPADAITTQNGVWVKSGATTRRWVGTIRASGTNVTEDSEAKRFVVNVYNQVERSLFKTDTTASWNYTTDSFQQARNQAANKVEFIIPRTGLCIVRLNASNLARNATAAVSFYCAIGEDSTTAASGRLNDVVESVSNVIQATKASYQKRPSIGYHYLAWLERSGASGTTTWFGEQSTGARTGLEGTIMC